MQCRKINFGMSCFLALDYKDAINDTKYVIESRDFRKCADSLDSTMKNGRPRGKSRPTEFSVLLVELK